MTAKGSEKLSTRFPDRFAAVYKRDKFDEEGSQNTLYSLTSCTLEITVITFVFLQLAMKKEEIKKGIGRTLKRVTSVARKVTSSAPVTAEREVNKNNFRLCSNINYC